MEPDGGYIFSYEESHGIKRALTPCEDLNAYACAILEHCTGSKTVEEIVALLKENSEGAPPDLFDQVESFLDEASQKGYICYSDIPTQVQGLLQGSTTHYTPSRVLLETTTKCNLKCGHCLLSAGECRPDELTTEELLSILETLSRIGVKRVVLSGGEILTKKGWDDLVHFCTQRFHTSLFTNATRIREGEADAFHSMKEVHISLYGSTAETHERISEVKGSFEKTVKGITALTQKGIYVGLSVLMVPFNLHQLEDIVKIALSLQCSIVRIGVTFSLGRARTKEWELTESQKEWLSKNMENLQRMYGIDIRWEEEVKGDKCGAGYSRWAITSNGDVYPCSVFRLKIGNLKKDDPSMILNSPAVKFLQELEPPSKDMCGDCEYLYVCNACHGHALTHSLHVNTCKWIDQFERAPESLMHAVWKG